MLWYKGRPGDQGQRGGPLDSLSESSGESPRMMVLRNFLLQELGSGSCTRSFAIAGADAKGSFTKHRRGVRDAFGYRCDITFKAHADSTQNTESNVALSALHSSQITPVQTVLRCEDLLA